VTIRWSQEALEDVDRLADFVAAYDPGLANEVEHKLNQAPKKLIEFHRLGARLSEFDPREVREFRVGRYLLRYELFGSEIRVLRFFHGREDRR
jgi:plasmid stabilization system protein ParE